MTILIFGAAVRPDGSPVHPAPPRRGRSGRRSGTRRRYGDAFHPHRGDRPIRTVRSLGHGRDCWPKSGVRSDRIPRLEETGPIPWSSVRAIYRLLREQGRRSTRPGGDQRLPSTPMPVTLLCIARHSSRALPPPPIGRRVVVETLVLAAARGARAAVRRGSGVMVAGDRNAMTGGPSPPAPSIP
jgi:hypothetical protein